MFEVTRVLFVWGDWAEAHHDVELVDAGGTRCRSVGGCPEGVSGLDGLHALIADHPG